MSFSEKSSGGCIPPEKGANQGEKKKKGEGIGFMR